MTGKKETEKGTGGIQYDWYKKKEVKRKRIRLGGKNELR